MNKRSKKLSKTALLYVFIAIFIAVLSLFSITLAWYIKTQKQTIGIKFANPVVVQIDYSDIANNSIIQSITGGTADSLKPGSKVTVNVGVSMAENSSLAYVRARMMLSCDVDNDGEVEYFDNYIKVVDKGGVQNSNVIGNTTSFVADSKNWEFVEFTDSDGNPDYWYVWKDDKGAAREVGGKDVNRSAQFYVGDILLSPEMDNRFANKKIRIEFVVEAIQTSGIVDPIYCQEWGKLK